MTDRRRRLATHLSVLAAALLLPPLAAAVGPTASETAASAAPTTQPIRCKLDKGILNGSLDLPSGESPFPVVLVIAGSGPTDRDGNQPAMKNDSLKLLGFGLAERGIAAVRYDKRGVAQSSLAQLSEADLTFEMLVDDAVRWIEQLRGDPRFTSVGVVGHSEGALIGLLAAKRAGASAYVSISGAGRSLPDVLREQLARKLPPTLMEACERIIGELAAGRTVDDTPVELFALFRPSVQPYLISVFRYEPTKEIVELAAPALIVQGETDLQVKVADAELLAAAKPDARLVVVEGMNHVLKTAGTLAEQQAAYTDPSLPLTPGLVDQIAAFLTETLGSESPATPPGEEAPAAPASTPEG
ncbi:MAG: alpha/beta hydrolase [Acidobacteriota bacterium]|nr:alpha/beta hydrolase [Acidobacteriota bacterium]